jgi:site-specific DNA-adenine methylase
MVYPGNKNRFIPDIVELLNPYFNEKTIFVEPFAGSAAVSLSVSQKEISKIILNELDKQIFKIHYSFKYGTYEQLKHVINEIWSFGDPKNIKEDYYTARTELNEKYFNVDSIESGFYNWAISTFAINSMVRFGPNGFNQGWGNRGIGRNNPSELMNERKYSGINEAYKKIELYNDDYKNIIDSLSGDFILFVDPPYIAKGSGTYSFNQENHNQFISKIKNIDKPVIYTDVYSETLLDNLGPGWYVTILRDNMGTGKPGENSKQIEKEAIYTNVKIPKANPLF